MLTYCSSWQSSLRGAVKAASLWSFFFFSFLFSFSFSFSDFRSSSQNFSVSAPSALRRPSLLCSQIRSVSGIPWIIMPLMKSSSLCSCDARRYFARSSRCPGGDPSLRRSSRNLHAGHWVSTLEHPSVVECQQPNTSIEGSDKPIAHGETFLFGPQCPQVTCQDSSSRHILFVSECLLGQCGKAMNIYYISMTENGFGCDVCWDDAGTILLKAPSPSCLFLCFSFPLSNAYT